MTRYGGIPENYDEENIEFDLPTYEAVPSSINWKAKGKTTPVKNQGGCGSCWAFAGTETIESAAAILTSQGLKTLAPQQFVNCCCNGCNGGNSCATFKYLIDHYAYLEANMPYQAKT